MQCICNNWSVVQVRAFEVLSTDPLVKYYTTSEATHELITQKYSWQYQHEILPKPSPHLLIIDLCNEVCIILAPLKVQAKSILQFPINNEQLLLKYDPANLLLWPGTNIKFDDWYLHDEILWIYFPEDSIFCKSFLITYITTQKAWQANNR